MGTTVEETGELRIQPRAERAGQEPDRARRVAGLALAVFVGGLLAWFLTTINVHSSDSCPEEAQVDAGEVTDLLPVPLELAPNSDTEVDFGRRRSPRTTAVFLQPPEAETEDNEVEQPALPAPDTALAVRAVDFERLSGDIELRNGVNVVALATVRRNQQGVQLEVCVDPDDVPAGQYQGSIVFDDPRVSAGAIPWTVRLQYEKWWVVAYGALVVSTAAFVYLYSSVKGIESKQGMWAYLDEHLIGVGAGVVAAGAAYFSAYWASTSWGGAADDWLKGAAVVFTAFTTGFLARFAGTGVRPKGEKEAMKEHAAQEQAAQEQAAQEQAAQEQAAQEQAAQEQAAQEGPRPSVNVRQRP